jgi:hypothetical protein
VYTLWVTIIHRGGRGSEMFVRRLRVGCWLRMESIGWRRSVTYLESSSRENANLPQVIWRNSKLEYSTLDWFTEWLPGNLKIDSRGTMYTTEGIPHFPHREPTNAAVESDNCFGCREICCALDNYYIQVMNMQCLSFHMSNHCRHQACCT